MDSSEDQKAKKAARALRARIDTIERHLEPLFSKNLSETYSKLSLNERCEFEVVLSYAINSLFFIYMKIKGHDPKDHEVMVELARVKQYVAKIKKAEGKGPKASLVINKDAAARFIKAALSNQDKPDKDEEKNMKRPREQDDTSSDGSDGESDEESDNGSKGKSTKKAAANEEVKGAGGSKKKARMDPFKSAR
ncbi:uncharacterized protein BYT42DRAFT_571615 [Radiomyces spectabilis]|uniref:uncharacterized protein n=1 Tax=Radiomyces spectabilis TaxID=64574 RepID=UPI0022202093|nr:uncharacterized protein BYT42DRAFT_571615 [Radiomyces spectabilis]KAI8377770.1 hypothetical protein BYT42DRAFT_571615 [Radiomyces spectabilis]